jgi:nitric oxide reductase large subunit
MKSPIVRAVLLFLLVLTFGVLIFGGYMINREKPPIPDKVVTRDGATLFSGADITGGQEYYFSRGALSGGMAPILLPTGRRIMFIERRFLLQPGMTANQ